MTLRPMRGRPVLAIVCAALTLALYGCASQRITPLDVTVSTGGVQQALTEAQSGTCPGTAPQTLASNVGGLFTQLEPLNATRVLLCVYPTQSSDPADSSGQSEGASAPPTPSSVTVTQTGAISGLQNALNALAAPPTAPVNCPLDTGASVLGIFTSGSQVTEVLIKTSGCPLVTDGPKVGWVGASDFISILSALLKT